MIKFPTNTLHSSINPKKGESSSDKIENLQQELERCLILFGNAQKKNAELFKLSIGHFANCYHNQTNINAEQTEINIAITNRFKQQQEALNGFSNKLSNLSSKTGNLQKDTSKSPKGLDHCLEEIKKINKQIANLQKTNTTQFKIASDEISKHETYIREFELKHLSHEQKHKESSASFLKLKSDIYSCYNDLYPKLSNLEAENAQLKINLNIAMFSINNLTGQLSATNQKIQSLEMRLNTSDQLIQHLATNQNYYNRNMSGYLNR